MSGPEMRQWTQAHVDAVVVLDGEAWKIQATTSTGDVVLLRRADDDCGRLASAARVRRAYLLAAGLSDNS